VIRLPRLALLTFASVVIAAGCGGSSGTPTPPPISDPHELITKSVVGVPAVKSLHVKFEISGQVDASSLTGGSGGSALSGNISLAGTTLEGDVDVAKQAADLKLAVPGLLGTTGEIIVADGNLYYKVSLLGPQYTKTPLGSTVPIAIPSAGSIPSVDPSAAIASLKSALDSVGAVATMKPDDKVAGKDAYHVSISIPVDKINTLLAADGSSTTAGMKLDSASFDYWVYKENLLPAKATIAGSAGALGNLTIVLTISDYNKSVSISAPPASEVKP
jgi:hypothetical protein